jgi:hypothetical protein
VSHYFAPAVYLLCFVASAICAFLLSRGFRRTPSPLLFWSAACFWLLTANNLLLVLDLLVFLPDLTIPRLLLSLAAASTLLFGFIWNGEGA